MVEGLGLGGGVKVEEEEGGGWRMVEGVVVRVRVMLEEG